MSDDDIPGDPVCYASKMIGGHIVDPQTFRDVSNFRKSERVRLIERRRRLESSARKEKTAQLIVYLREILQDVSLENVAVYWPIRGEPDLRPLMTELSREGYGVLLPVVVARNEPLEFHSWFPGCAMSRGFWNIPVPATGKIQIPDTVISPVVGVDDSRFRLGNGGAYYDRTLAAFSEKPRTIGIGFEFCRISTIFPMPWDIPMDIVVTENGEM